MDAAEAHLVGEAWTVVRHETTAPGDATRLARRFAGEVDLLVIAGGDGTVRESAEGLDGAEGAPVLGFVPLGNGNVLASELGVPEDPASAVEVLTSGEPRRLDVLRANGRIALAMVGVGYDAVVTRWVHIARTTPPFDRWYRLHGDSVYALAGFAALFAPWPPRFTVTSDGNRLAPRYCAANLCNVENYAKGWAMAPGANAWDGRLDYQLRKRSLFPFTLLSILRAAQRRPSPAFVSDHGSARAVLLEAKRPFRWQADGDPMGTVRRLEVEVLPKHLRLMLPRH